MMKLARLLFSSAVTVVLLVAASGPVAALELLKVERPGCAWCQRWDAEIAPIYGKTDEGRRAPLYRAHIHDLPRDVQFREPIVFVPTFVLIDDGREVGRVEGYSGQDMFWGLLGKLLDTHSPHIR